MGFETKTIREDSVKLDQMKDNARALYAKIRVVSVTDTWIKKAVLVGAILFVAYLGWFCWSLLRTLNFDISIPNIINTFWGQDLKQDRFGKTNILLMGVAGGLHDGAELTDSLMVISYDYNKKIASFISIPRDLFVKITPEKYDRINLVYDYINRHEGKEAAVIAMKQLIERITGLEIQYYAKMNFKGFKDVVDILGGVDVNVPERLVDEAYPMEDDHGVFIRNELLVVEKGLQHMDGDLALKYTRSRHSTSDFDRGLRQQSMISAVKEKALKENYLTNPNALKRLFYAVSSNIEMDINMSELIRATNLFKDINRDHMISVGLNDDLTRVGGFLYTPARETTGGASVLIPDGGTVGNFDYYMTIRRFVDMVTNSQEVLTQKAKIRILNGTKTSGLGKVLKDKLARFGFTVTDTGNTENRQQFEKTQIRLINPDVQASFDSLQTFIFGDIIESASTSASGVSIQQDMPDIEIIIGKDYTRYIP